MFYGDNNYSKEYKKFEKRDKGRKVSDGTEQRYGRRNWEVDKRKNTQDSHLGVEKKSNSRVRFFSMSCSVFPVSQKAVIMATARRIAAEMMVVARRVT